MRIWQRRIISKTEEHCSWNNWTKVSTSIQLKSTSGSNETEVFSCALGNDAPTRHISWGSEYKLQETWKSSKQTFSTKRKTWVCPTQCVDPETYCIKYRLRLSNIKKFKGNLRGRVRKAASMLSLQKGWRLNNIQYAFYTSVMWELKTSSAHVLTLDLP